MRFASLLLACLTTLYGPVAAATIVTFENLSDIGEAAEVYIESGISISGSPAFYTTPGSVHLDDAGSPYGSLISVTTGGQFSLVSADVIGLGQMSYMLSEEGDFLPVAHDNVWFRGFLAGIQVAEFQFSTGFELGTTLIEFGAGFGMLDMLTISAETLLPVGAICTDVPCGHFSIDNLAVAPVPLPAAGWLLLAGIAGILTVAKRKHTV